MSKILDKILAAKAIEVAAAKLAVPEIELAARARDLPPPRDFVGAIRARHSAGRSAVIAEMKRASPSQGAFRVDFDAASFARSYEQNGAACLSVLTDAEFFGARPEDLAQARAVCSLPVLRKDFMIDAYQVIEARAMGADCILLISGAINLSLMSELEQLATSLGMSVLVESHTAGQLAQALRLQTPLVGINNRDLTTFQTDLGITEALCSSIPADKIAVAESGITEPRHVRQLQTLKVNTYLIGGAFMRSPDPGMALRTMFPDPGP